MKDGVAVFILESACTIGHKPRTLRRTNNWAKICLRRLTKDAGWSRTLRSVARDYMISWLDRHHALADALNNTSSLMTQDAGEEPIK